jgi:hypothetical protein
MRVLSAAFPRSRKEEGHRAASVRGPFSDKAIDAECWCLGWWEIDICSSFRCYLGPVRDGVLRGNFKGRVCFTTKHVIERETPVQSYQ